MDLFDFAPGREGYYGDYGGAFVPEILHSTIEELREGFRACKNDPAFWQEYRALLADYSGRPTPVTFLANLSQLARRLQGVFFDCNVRHVPSEALRRINAEVAGGAAWKTDRRLLALITLAVSAATLCLLPLLLEYLGSRRFRTTVSKNL